jgi:ATP-binding cassette subfamily B protein
MSSAQGKIFDVGILKRVMKYVRPYKKRFYITAVLVVVLAGLGPVRPVLIGRAVDVQLANGDLVGLLQIFLIVVGVLLLEAVLQFYQTYLANWVAQSVTLDLRSKL